MTVPVDGEIRHVTDTAFLVAQCRADESARPDALFSDPLAAKLAGEKGVALVAASGRAPITRWLLAVRTVVIDALIADAIHNGVDTVLNLGAGLDTRPYRLDLPPDLNWIEIDFPRIISYKESILGAESPHCHLERISADLGDDDVRRALVHDIDARTQKLLVITEGVTPYLSNDQVSTLAADLGAMKSRTWWINDYFSEAVHRYRDQNGVSARMREAPFLFRPGNWWGFFAKRGWVVREIRYLPIEGRRMSRPFPVPRRARSFKTVLWYLFRPRKRKEFAVSLGFAMMEHSPSPAATAHSSVSSAP